MTSRTIEEWMRLVSKCDKVVTSTINKTKNDLV